MDSHRSLGFLHPRKLTQAGLDIDSKVVRVTLASKAASAPADRVQGDQRLAVIIDNLLRFVHLALSPTDLLYEQLAGGGLGRGLVLGPVVLNVGTIANYWFESTLMMWRLF